MNFYVSVFKTSKVGRVTRYGEAGPDRRGPLGPPHSSRMGKNSTHSTATRYSASRRQISFFVNSETQQEIDELWEKLSAGGKKSRCGRLKDKYGLSWQIISSVLGKMLQDKRCGESKEGHESNAANGQNRDKPFAGGIRPRIKSGRFLGD
jgi:predicted 3-demethylubiquinone-9 3-methyltransferase (glyoxalase superfamily)